MWWRGMGKMPIPPTFYSFTFKDMLLWWRGMGKMPIPPTFYSFTFKDMLLWWRGMGKMPIPPTFYSSTFLLFYFFKVVLSFSFCSSAVLDGSGGAVVIASEAR